MSSQDAYATGTVRSDGNKFSQLLKNDLQDGKEITHVLNIYN